MTVRILFLVSVLVGSARAQETTMRISLAFGNDDITFNSTRVSPAEVNRWMQLSPYIGIENNYLTPESIDQVMGYLPGEVGCGSRGGVKPRGAELALGRIRQRVRDLDPDHYPTNLAKVVLYVRRIQSFALWADTQLLSFVKTCDLPALESEFDGISPRSGCGGALGRIAKAKGGFEAYGWARSAWADCVWGAEMKQIGPYPKDAWQCFLSAHGIREHFIADAVD